MSTDSSNSSIVSIVAPFYNEETGVEEFRHRLTSVLASLPHMVFEVICVNDGSTDDTLKQLLLVSEADPRFSVIDLSRNFGKEAALTAGLDEASGDAVIPMDADLQDPPELIPELIARWQDGYDVVLARRVERDADTWWRRTTASLFYRVHNRISETKIPQDVGDFRLMDRSVVTALKQLPERRRFLKGLFAWVGFRTTSVDYVRRGRTDGLTKFSTPRLITFALDGLTGFSTVPLRFWTYLGTLIACSAFTYAMFIVVRTLIFGVDVPGYASLLTVGLFMGGVQLIGIGVIGEYIGRIYAEVKQRPLYLVRRRYPGTAKATGATTSPAAPHHAGPDGRELTSATS